MVQKRDMAPLDAGAPARADLQWLELLAYAHGCCLDRSEETKAEPPTEPEAPLAGGGGVLH